MTISFHRGQRLPPNRPARIVRLRPGRRPPSWLVRRCTSQLVASHSVERRRPALSERRTTYTREAVPRGETVEIVTI